MHIHMYVLVNMYTSMELSASINRTSTTKRCIYTTYSIVSPDKGKTFKFLIQKVKLLEFYFSGFKVGIPKKFRNF